MLTKVEGHATEAEVEAGTVKRIDKVGNDFADICATNGVRANACAVVLLLVERFHERHGAYGKLAHRVQGMIIVVRKAEKAERLRRHALRTMTQGYDDAKEADVSCTIIDDALLETPTLKRSAWSRRCKECTSSKSIKNFMRPYISLWALDNGSQ